MDKIIAWMLVGIVYVLWFWVVPLFIWKPTAPAWFRVAINHAALVIGVGLGMLIIWVIKVLVLG